MTKSSVCGSPAHASAAHTIRAVRLGIQGTDPGTVIQMPGTRNHLRLKNDKEIVRAWCLKAARRLCTSSSPE
jgi:hypothetical protein